MMEDYDPKSSREFGPKSRAEMGRYGRTWSWIAISLFVLMIVAIVIGANLGGKKTAQMLVPPGQSTNGLANRSIAPPTLNKSGGPPMTTGQGGDSH